MLDLPVCQWPPMVCEHEPAHGFFIRLAAANGSFSTGSFAGHVGVNGRNFDLAELLGFCQTIPVKNIHELAASTPSFDGPWVILSGERFLSKSDWSLAQPRVCEACLGESRHYRNWWDLTTFGRCPLHDRPLVDGDGDTKLAWWCADIGRLTSGRHIQGIRPIRPTPVWFSFESYVLGRMGIMERVPHDLLDGGELHEVIATAELLGRAATFGWRARAPKRIGSATPERRAVIATGFQALSAGIAGVKRLLVEYTKDRPRRDGADDGQRLFGWLFQVVYRMDAGFQRQVLSTAMAEAAEEHRILVFKKDRPHLSEGRRPICLNDAARLLGVRSDALRGLAIRLGLTRKTLAKCKPRWFYEEDLHQISHYISQLVGRDEAKAILGADEKDFGCLSRAGVVECVSHMKYRKWYERGSIERIKEECAPARFILSHSRGSIKPHETLILEIVRDESCEVVDDVRWRLAQQGVSVSHSGLQKFLIENGWQGRRALSGRRAS